VTHFLIVKQIHIMSLNEEQQNRFHQLKTNLASKGLELRQDSDLCWDYVLCGEKAKNLKDPVLIAQRMAEAEYLHKYCDYQRGYNIAQNIAKKRRIQKLPALARQDWLELINEMVLVYTTILGTYPEVWPWMQNISIEEWKLKNTKTDMF